MRFSPTRWFVAEAGCLWPFRADVKPPSEPENAKMRRGKEIHRAIEDAVGDDTPTSHPIAASAYRWQRERGEGMRRVELVVGVDPIGGQAREFETKDDVPSDWMPVVADLVIALPDRVEVWDWKTGSRASTFDYAPQVRANALGVASLLGEHDILSGLAYPSERDVLPKEWRFDAFDLAEMRVRLRGWAQAAPKAQPTPCSACRYCPVRTICPMQSKGGSQ